MIDGLKDMLLFVTDADGEIVGPDGVAITEDDVDDEGDEDAEDDAKDAKDAKDADCNFTVSADKLRPGNILKIQMRGMNKSKDGSAHYWVLPIDIKIK